MYFQVKSCVKCCNTYSEYVDYAIGLKQGKVISPILFSLFLDDQELFLQNGNDLGLSLDDLNFIRMFFADDMVIFRKNIEWLQNSLNILKSYCDKWGPEVNTSKTKVMVFRNRGSLRNNEVWFYARNKLDVVDNL